MGVGLVVGSSLWVEVSGGAGSSVDGGCEGSPTVVVRSVVVQTPGVEDCCGGGVCGGNGDDVGGGTGGVNGGWVVGASDDAGGAAVVGGGVCGGGGVLGTSVVGADVVPGWQLARYGHSH